MLMSGTAEGTSVIHDGFLSLKSAEVGVKWTFAASNLEALPCD
jgi:hypothetical protein